MKDYLKILQTILNDLHLTVESQAVSELHQSFEDRYKEDAEEFGEKSISDEEYLEKIIPSAQKSDKYQTVIISLAAKILKENGKSVFLTYSKDLLKNIADEKGYRLIDEIEVKFKDRSQYILILEKI